MVKRQPDLQRPPIWRWLTRAAFALTLILVIARLLQSEVIRIPGQAVPGELATPLGPGAATGLVLDLLAMAPALLVLGRASLDGNYRLRWSWAAAGLLALGFWAVASTLWSADRFAAIVSSMHWLSAMVLLWSTVQLVDSWQRVRFVSGVCLGLLITLVVAGYYYRLVEWRDLRNAWETSRTDILREHSWAADSFDARQFEKRILSGATMGFSASPNTYGALLVLLGTVSAGIALSRIDDADPPGWIIPPILAICCAAPDLLWADSRGAAGTAVMAALLLIGCGWFRSRLREKAHKVYWLTLVGTLVLALAVIGHGLHHGTLFHDSLTFRWRYWLGAARLIAAHPLLGVGWENFGLRYLAFRIPIASEEIRDPHNFIVRIVAELGTVGGALLAFGLLRLAWEGTQLPARPPNEELPDTKWWPREQRQRASQRILLIATLAILLNFFASIDLTSTPSYVLIEAMRRALFWLLLIVGISAATLRVPSGMQRRLRDHELEYSSDTRPAPWLLCSMLVGLAMFFVHNLIDFALFEPGPMFLFALLAGTVLGARQAPAPTVTRGRAWAIAVGAPAVAAWIAAAVLIAVPIMSAESLAHDADEAIRNNQPAPAARDLEAAFARVPYNSDYAFRAAILRISERQLDPAADLISAAIAANPATPDAFVWRAQLALASPHHDVSAARADMEKALALDPHSVDLHKRYGEMLTRLDLRADATAQYQLALDANEGLDSHDAKRLSAVEVEALRRLASPRPSPGVPREGEMKSTTK